MSKNDADSARRELIFRHLFFSQPGQGSRLIQVRMKPDMLAALDRWIHDFYDSIRPVPGGGGKMTRQAAVRWIVYEHLLNRDNPDETPPET
jgi:hypothetical protein